jgi:hypothetical protein
LFPLVFGSKPGRRDKQQPVVDWRSRSQSNAFSGASRYTHTISRLHLSKYCKHWIATVITRSNRQTRFNIQYRVTSPSFALNGGIAGWMAPLPKDPKQPSKAQQSPATAITRIHPECYRSYTKLESKLATRIVRGPDLEHTSSQSLHLLYITSITGASPWTLVPVMRSASSCTGSIDCGSRPTVDFFRCNPTAACAIALG